MTNKTNLALVIDNFFQRPDVVQICPNVKKKTKNLSNSQESNQIHYRLGHELKLNWSALIPHLHVTDRMM